MRWNDQLVSVIILCYQNQGQLRPTLESVLKQNYARLEIILADDSSDTFDACVWENWINRNKEKNIENIVVFRNDVNLGTVKNLRKALSVMHGAYYMTISAGDIFYTNDVISTLMIHAAHNNHRELVIMGKAVHCDSNYQLKNDILPESDYAILRDRDSNALFRRLIYRCCVTAVSSMHRKDFAEIVEGYDTDYRYYEDYPSYLRMARKGFTPLFVDKIVTLHVMDGIANNADTATVEAVKGFYNDRELLYQKDIRPFLQGQPRNVIKKLTLRREMYQNQYLWTLWKKYTDIQRAFLILHHPWFFYFSLPKGLKTIERLFRGGVFCLLFLALLKSSGALHGTLDMLVEYLLLGGCMVGLLSQVVYRSFALFFLTRSAWRKAAAGSN